jgi:hypothetical protein
MPAARDWLCRKYAIPRISERGDGAIINLTALAGKRDTRSSALGSRHCLLDIACVSRAVLFDLRIDQDEKLLSFVFWQLLHLRNDYFLKSHEITSFVNAPNVLQAQHRKMETEYYTIQRWALGAVGSRSDVGAQVVGDRLQGRCVRRSLSQGNGSFTSYPSFHLPLLV